MRFFPASVAITSNRHITIDITGDVNSHNTFEAGANPDSPSSVTVHSLVVGTTAIPIPTGSVGATILPPLLLAGATAPQLRLKGDLPADKGLWISAVDPTSLGLPRSFPPAIVPTVLHLQSDKVLTGLRILWT